MITINADYSEPQLPYKLLDYYVADDASNFFGRETEAQQLQGLVSNHRLIVLYGGSGTGKTSLILAGAGPLLSKATARHELIYIRALADPDPIIRHSVRRRLKELATNQKTTAAAPAPLLDFREQLYQSFNIEELQDICFEIGLEFEDLPGDTKKSKVRELVLMAERQAFMARLVKTCQRLRPNIAWEAYLQVNRAAFADTRESSLQADGSLAEFLASAADLIDANIVIVLDQFEEFFIRLSPDIRTAFIDELAGIYDSLLGRVKVLISLREEWLAQIGEIEMRIPEIFNNRMRLLPLSREQARQAITAPVEKWAVAYEEALLDRLLDDLTADTPGVDDGAVVPPQLQLVCSTLFKRLIPPETLIEMNTYEQLGGSIGVLRQYLEDELSRLNFDERLIARSILEELTTSKGTKAVKSADELALALSLEIDATSKVLDRLVRARLLRALERVTDGSVVYELAHEYLIGEIYQSGKTHARKQTEELIAQEIENWQRLGTLISAEKLALIYRLRSELRLSGEAHELLLRSALQTGVNVDYWLEQASDVQQRTSILGEAANSENVNARLRAVQGLGKEESDAAALSLAHAAVYDSNADVRRVAQEQLSQTENVPLSVIELLEVASKDKDRETRDAAFQTVTVLPKNNLPTNLRWRARFVRTRRLVLESFSAVVGGSIAFLMLVLFVYGLISAIIPGMASGLWASLDYQTVVIAALLGAIVGIVQHWLLPEGSSRLLSWTLLAASAVTLGWILGSILTQLLLEWLLLILRIDWAEIVAGILFALVVAFIVGITQWWLLRREIWGRRWFWLTVWGTTITTVTILLLRSSSTLDSNIGLAVILGVGGITGVALLASYRRIEKLGTSRRDLFAIGTSTIIGFLVWGSATGGAVTNPSGRLVASRMQGVPLQVSGLDQETTLTAPLPRTVAVDYVAPEFGMPSIEPSTFQAAISLSEGITGITQIPVEVTTTNPSIIVNGTDPAQVMVSVAAIISQSMPIKVHVEDVAMVSTAYEIIGQPVAVPDDVIVSGPEPSVNAVAEVQADISMEKVVETTSVVWALFARDASGNLVTDVTIDPAMAEVTVVIRQRANARDVGVRAVATGSPPEGYWLSGLSVEPDSVTIQGSPGEIARIGSVDTLPVDVSDVMDRREVEVALELPGAVQVVDIEGNKVTRVKVTALVAPLEGDLLMQRPVEFINDSGLRSVAADPLELELLVSGPQRLLKQIEQQPQLVRVVVDARELLPGSRVEVTPDIIAPEGIRVQYVGNSLLVTSEP